VRRSPAARLLAISLLAIAAVAGSRAPREEALPVERLTDPAQASSHADDAARRSVAAKAPRLALALGGGAALGYAHLGVLEVLEAEGIRPDLVLGTSMGSLIGGWWCAGVPADSIALLAEQLNIFRLLDWKPGGLGLFEWKKARRRMEPRLGGLRLEDCPVPLVCVATDLFSGERVLLDRGPLLDAMLASATVPGLFEPVPWEGRLLVDGGLVDEVPVHSAIDCGAQVIVAVDVSHPLLGRELNGPFDAVRQAYFIIQMHNVDGRRDLADVLIRPDLEGLDFHKFGEVEAARRAGRSATLAALPEIRAALQAR
jgi:NTE family protein